MPPENGSPWNGDARLALGRALHDAHPEGLTAAQLEDITGRHQSNLKKLADALVAEEVLVAAEPAAANGRPGRPARDAYAFAAGEYERFEEVAEEKVEIGRLEAGMQFVIVDSGKEEEALVEILSQGDVVFHGAWAVELIGEETKTMIFFKGPSAVHDSGDLMAVFSAAELKAQRGSVNQVETVREAVKVNRRRKQRIENSRRRRRAGQTSPRIES